LFRRALRFFQVPYFLAILLVVLACHPPLQAASPPDSPPTLVAIGDVHGDYNDFCTILQRVGLIDDQHHWSGGKITFVQVGDLIDRGPESRQVLDLMISLNEEATKAGGRVVSLLGNHEVMNFMGDLRYVPAETYASFADSESEKRQKSAYQEYAAWRKSHPQLLQELPNPVLPETEAEWLTRHPLGFIEQRDAFSPKGRYGKWLRERSAVAMVGGIIFLHGGISPKVAPLKLDKINSQIRNEIQQYDEILRFLTDANVVLPSFTLQETAAVVQGELLAERKSRVPSNPAVQAKILQFLDFSNWLCVREDGPLWFRGYDKWSEQEGLPQAEKILRAYNATNIVVGHTVQRTATIRPRFGGKIFLIDTGMLSTYYPGGKASALEIGDDGSFTAVYLDQQVVLLEKKEQSVPK
jgi:Calcineurin-like phosphoesterase